mmetsp:Transcript_11715/g.28870  ORF Transcript_11715/g.28870 Transcript_11715/m.28870 type:complete len:305 (-) Transcript_11715:392-1306(-)
MGGAVGCSQCRKPYRKEPGPDPIETATVTSPPEEDLARQIVTRQRSLTLKQEELEKREREFEETRRRRASSAAKKHSRNVSDIIDADFEPTHEDWNVNGIRDSFMLPGTPNNGPSNSSEPNDTHEDMVDFVTSLDALGSSKDFNSKEFEIMEDEWAQKIDAEIEAGSSQDDHSDIAGVIPNNRKGRISRALRISRHERTDSPMSFNLEEEFFQGAQRISSSRAPVLKASTIALVAGTPESSRSKDSKSVRSGRSFSKEHTANEKPAGSRSERTPGTQTPSKSLNITMGTPASSPTVPAGSHELP